MNSMPTSIPQKCPADSSSVWESCVPWPLPLPLFSWMSPFSALDPMTRRTLQQEMKSLQQKLNKTIVFVTHDMEEALDLADLIIFMNHGKIEQMASPEEMLSHPATGLIHDFLGKHMPEQSAADLKVKEFMRTGVYTVEQTRGINECISKNAAAQRGHL